MNFLDFFGRKKSVSDRPIAHALKFRGKGEYPISFPGTGYGVVFEDDGDTGYLYATDERHDEIFDALHIYDAGTSDQFRRSSKVYIVWHPASKKAALYVRRECHAVIDFLNQRCCCRTGFPDAAATWRSNHQWIPGIESEFEA